MAVNDGHIETLTLLSAQPEIDFGRKNTYGNTVTDLMTIRSTHALHPVTAWRKNTPSIKHIQYRP